jgi:serine/threonine protein kinase
MITADYKAILIDFGSARQFEEDKTQSHTAMLTHGYAPTEQYTRNSRKGAYTDIYSIGATLYFILTGQVPVEAAARIVEPMPEPKQLNPSIPDEANRTILKAMQLKPADRYQSVQTFLNDLLNKNNPQQQIPIVPPPAPKAAPVTQTPKTPTAPPPMQKTMSAPSDKPTTKTKYCKKCGTAASSPEAKFCRKCGTKLN